jgi:hypothetical protein
VQLEVELTPVPICTLKYMYTLSLLSIIIETAIGLQVIYVLQLTPDLTAFVVQMTDTTLLHMINFGVLSVHGIFVMIQLRVWRASAYSIHDAQGAGGEHQRFENNLIKIRQKSIRKISLPKI